jgi:hypothetical protein
MASKQVRNTTIWLKNEDRLKNLPKNGPGCYETLAKPLKESFNFGHVPFGSGIDRTRLKGGAL